MNEELKELIKFYEEEKENLDSLIKGNVENGEYKEGEAILRMKMDMQNPNPQFWDLVAYRVLYTARFRT